MELEHRIGVAASRTLISAFVFLAMSLLKIYFGYFSGLPILVADGVHNFADFLMFIAAYVGLRLSLIGPTKNFRYGLYKAENLSAFVMSMFIIYAVYEIFLEGIRFTVPRYPLIGITVQVVSLVIDLALAVWLGNMKLKQVSLINAETLHNYEDSILSLIVLIGIIMLDYELRYPYYAVLIITVAIILYQVLMILKDSTLALLDATDKRIEKVVDESVKEIREISGYHDLRVRKAGPYYFIELHLELPPNVSVRKADKITDELEKRIKEKEPLVLLVNPHVEPSEIKKETRALIPAGQNGEVSNFAQASGVVLAEIESGKMNLLENPFKKMERRRLPALVEFIREHGVNIVVTNRIEEPLMLALFGAGVEVYLSDDDYITALEKLRAGQLKPAELKENI
ncbi:MAG: cation diffusion facilitator family transporter [Nitrososphaeria archaeon]